MFEKGWWGCAGKTRYDNRGDAVRALRIRKKRRGHFLRETRKAMPSGLRLEAYRCKGCDGWHIGRGYDGGRR